MTRSAAATLPTLATPRSGSSPLRSAFSLLEVLIAMFILTVGMLGIAAAVVIGNASALQALVADRVASVGRNGLAEVRTRELLDSTRWLNADGSPVVKNPDEPFAAGDAFCIDPLYIATVNATQTQIPNPRTACLVRFPYSSTTPSSPPYFESSPYLPAPQACLAMQRVTLNIAPVQPPTVPQLQQILMNPRLFERIFVAEDDLNVDLTTLSRPRLLFRTDTGQTLPLPVLPRDAGGGTPLYPDYQGMYSWMVTVVPDIPRGTIDQQKYIVSVVVFRNRVLLPPDDPSLETPAERVAVANMLGGGDVRLSVLASDLQKPGGGSYNAAEYLRVREGQYILLAGRQLVTPGNPGVFQNVFLWYRVIATGELYQPSDPKPFTGDSNHYYREFTLAGPDWNPAWCAQTDSDGDGTPEVQAILCSEVYGVYSQVMEPDALSRFSVPVR